MSGPKGSTYSVEENRRREEARRAELRRQLEGARQELHLLAAHAQVHADAGANIDLSVSDPAVDLEDSAAMATAIASLSQQAARLRSRTTAAVAAMEREQTVAALVEGVQRAGTLDAADAVAASERAGAAAAAREQASQVETIMSELSPEITVGRDELDRLADECVRTHGADATRLLRRLERSVRAANIDAGRRGEARAEAQQLSLELVGFVGAEELQRRLGLVIDGQSELSDQLREQVASFIDSARAADDRSYAADMLRESLESLGYEVGDTFVTDLVTTQVASIERPGWNDHLLEVHLPLDDPRVVMAAVREGQPGQALTAAQRTRDEEVETEFCSTVQDLISALDERGVEMGPFVGTRPGETQMRVISSSRAERRARRGAGHEELEREDPQ